MPLYKKQVSDTSYSSSWDATTNKAPSKNTIWDADFYQNDVQRAFSALGSSIKYSTLLSIPTSTIAFTDNQAYYTAIYISKATTITGVKWYQGVQGVYTADQNNYVALYSYSGGTMTQVAISTNDGNIWKGTGSTWQSVAFTSTYAAQPGIYFIAALYNQSAQTTAPTIACGTSLVTASTGKFDFTNSATLSSITAGQNSLPATQAMSGVTTSGALRYFALY